jgi:hypothetical protein
MMMMLVGLVLGQPFEGKQSDRVPIELVRENTKREIRMLLKTATGFTGHDAALLFRRV